MTLAVFLVWMVNIAFDTVGQLSFKAAATRHDGHTGLRHWKDMAGRPWLWLGVFCYLAEFPTWIALLSMIQLSIGVMLASINMVVIMVAGKIFFGERLTLWRVLGLTLITAGVVFVGMDL